MRALLVHPGPHFSVQDVYTGWRDGLRANGVEVAEYNLGDRLSFYDLACLEGSDGVNYKAFEREAAIEMALNGLYAACYKWWPDVVIVVSGFFTKPDLLHVLRSRRHKIVILHTESPYEDERQLALAPLADLNLLNDPTNLSQFQTFAPSYYLPHAYRPDVHHPRQVDNPDLASEFCFVGTGYQSRIDFLEQVDFTGVDVALAGNWQALGEDSPLRKFVAHDVDMCCSNDEAVQLYAATKASANLYRQEAERPHLSAGWAMGPREVELAACGTFFLRDPRPESDAVLPMLPTFTGPADFGEQLRWWLGHDTERATAVEQARAAVADRTFTNHAAQMLRWLDI